MNQETRDQLREILCEVPEVENDIKKPRIWCVFVTPFMWWTRVIKRAEWYYENIEFWFTNWYTLERMDSDWQWLVIWNPLQERHLFMYCESKWVRLLRASNWLLFTMSIKESEIKTQKEKLSVLGECKMKVICILENQDLEDQSEETGQKLIKFLLDNK